MGQQGKAEECERKVGGGGGAKAGVVVVVTVGSRPKRVEPSGQLAEQGCARAGTDLDARAFGSGTCMRCEQLKPSWRRRHCPRRFGTEQTGQSYGQVPATMCFRTSPASFHSSLTYGTLAPPPMHPPSRTTPSPARRLVFVLSPQLPHRRHRVGVSRSEGAAADRVAASAAADGWLRGSAGGPRPAALARAEGAGGHGVRLHQREEAHEHRWVHGFMDVWVGS